ncbi:MAG: hypothetical protein J6O39_00120 [Treponema sp.]|nr:hypothetical protein [Treponema sp.]
MKKLTGILFAAAFSILSASCISFKNTAYVEGSDDFTVIPVTSKSFGKILQWNGYELSMSSVERDISQKTVFGVGKKSGTISQKGTFSRDGNEVFSTSIYRRIDGWVDEDEFSSTNFFDENFTIETGKNDTIFYLSAQDDGIMIQDSQIIPVVITKVNTYKNSKGKTYSLMLGATCGAKVTVLDELYAVIDTFDKSIRLNPSFSRELTDEQKDILASLMLEYYNYDTVFKQTDISSTTSFGIN